MDQTGMRCRPSQRVKRRAFTGASKASGRVDMSRYVKTCTNTRKITKLIFISVSRDSLHIAKSDRGEPSSPLCLSPHDAFATYTYLHCPMRLSRLGNLFA